MEGIWRFAAIILIAFLVIPAGAEKGQSLYKQGKDLEARQNYEAAYDAYLKAYDANPADTQYRAALTRIRFIAAAAKVHRATLLREAGQLEEALKLFEEAAAIDPSSSIASRQLLLIRQMLQRTNGIQPTSPPRQTGVSSDVMNAQGPPALSPISALPITLKLSEDSKVVYETIGKLAGLNVLFDPDYSSRRITIELVSVTLQEALDLLAAQSKTFWKPMTPNTIFVATDNPAKRKELEENVVKTFYLSNITLPTELQDVVNTLRTIVDVSRIQQLPSKEAIVIRGTPDQMLLAEKIVNDFDQAAPEVVVDFALMQVSRDKVKTLGISPPTSAAVQLQNNYSSSSSTSSSSSSTSSSSLCSSNAGDCVNLNTLAYLNATDFVAKIGSASASALFTDSNTKIIQNPQVRSLNGQKASIKIGERVPTATGSYQSGVSGVSVSGLVNTQFQYIDVGVNVDVTPHIHADGDVTLKLMVDVSSVASYQNIGGVDEPVIGQRKVEHEIRLKDGEVSLIGGMMELDNTSTLTGYPGLSQIPFLKYLFSQKNTKVTDTEIVFAVIPHIVRGKELTELNRRTLDVGTGASIKLRHALKAESAKDATLDPVAVPLAQAPGQTVAALELDPTAISVPKDTTFAVNVVLSGAQNVSSVPLNVAYDNNALQLLNISNGDFLSQGGQIVSLVHREDQITGAIEITASRPPASGGVSGHGAVAILTFQAKSPGRSSIKITNGTLVQSNRQGTAISGSEAPVLVQ